MEDQSKHTHLGIVLVPLFAAAVGILLLLLLGWMFGTPEPAAVAGPQPEKVELALKPTLEYIGSLFRIG